MSNWIFLSKNGEDSFMNMFAKGCGVTPTSTEDFVYEDSNAPIVMRGILKHKLIKRCWEDRRDFYFMDSGYFGNEVTRENPNGWKYWHRIVKNNIQHTDVIKRPNDRFLKLGKSFLDWKTNGSKILIAAPDEKPCKFYGIDQKTWMRNTVKTIREHTDRPIVIRERTKNRDIRMKISSFQEALQDDVFAVVTFNSNAAVESVLSGIPVFALAPIHAAAPVSCQDISKINTPYYPSRDQLNDWACHLSYGQFHVSELRDGSAKRKLEEWYE